MDFSEQDVDIFGEDYENEQQDGGAHSSSPASSSSSSASSSKGGASSSPSRSVSSGKEQEQEVIGVEENSDEAWKICFIRSCLVLKGFVPWGLVYIWFLSSEYLWTHLNNQITLFLRRIVGFLRDCGPDEFGEPWLFKIWLTYLYFKLLFW